MPSSWRLGDTRRGALLPIIANALSPCRACTAHRLRWPPTREKLLPCTFSSSRISAWSRVELLTRQWDDDAWPLVRQEFAKALALRSRMRKADRGSRRPSDYRGPLP